MPVVYPSIQDLRYKFGYVNAGNNSATMYIINWLLVIGSAVVVYLVWSLYNKKEGVTDAERKDMLFVGIIASILLFLMAVPINISRTFTNTVSRHPIYFVYLCLAIFLITFVGIYHDKVDSTEQKGYVIAILIILGLIILGSSLMLWWTSHPYAKNTPIEILGDEDFYAINNQLYTKNLKDKKNIDIINKFLSTGSSSKDLTSEEMTTLKDYYNGKTSGNNKVNLDDNHLSITSYEKTSNERNLLNFQLSDYLKQLKKDKKKNVKIFYALARFKQGYDNQLSRKSEDKKEDMKTYMEKYAKDNKNDFRIILNNQKVLIETVQQDGVLKPEDYNKYLGYYDPYIGGASSGYVTEIEDLKVEKAGIETLQDDTMRQLKNQKAIVPFMAKFKETIKENIKNVVTDETKRNNVVNVGTAKLQDNLQKYIAKLEGEKEVLAEPELVAENYIKKLKDCDTGTGGVKIDFSKKLSQPTGVNQIRGKEVAKALQDCLENNEIE